MLPHQDVRKDPWPGEKVLQLGNISAWLCGPLPLLTRLLGRYRDFS